jgi:hypothetical protein
MPPWPSRPPRSRAGSVSTSAVCRRGHDAVALDRKNGVLAMAVRSLWPRGPMAARVDTGDRQHCSEAWQGRRHSRRGVGELMGRPLVLAGDVSHRLCDRSNTSCACGIKPTTTSGSRVRPPTHGPPCPGSGGARGGAGPRPGPRIVEPNMKDRVHIEVMERELQPRRPGGPGRRQDHERTADRPVTAP